MTKMDRFLITFGQWSAFGLLLGILLGSMQAAAPVDPAMYPWIKLFDQAAFLTVVGLTSLVGAAVGSFLGLLDVLDQYAVSRMTQP